MHVDHEFPRLGDLVRKYGQAGPRYTSYPPAPHFTSDFTAEDFLSKLARMRMRHTNVEEGPAADLHGHNGLSLYVHLPFCRSLCYYCGCHMMVTHRSERVERYLDYLKKEIHLTASHLGDANRVVQLHWGGGTPTYLSPVQISDLMTEFAARFHFVKGAEISIEADPRGLTPAHLEAAREAGFNRISVGVQDLDPRVQVAINRIQSARMIEQATEAARRFGFESISYDLVYGLPRQTPEGFVSTLQRVIHLSPDRISLFSYAHVPWAKKGQRMIQDATLPSAETRMRIYIEAARMLTEDGGYRHIGMDHFARPGDPLARALDAGTLQRNFQGYSTHAGSDLIGFGVSSISQIEDAYAANVLGLTDYYRALDGGMPATSRGYRMTRDDRIRHHVIMKLMCHLSVDVADAERRFGIDFWRYFAAVPGRLREMEEDGLVEIAPGGLRVTGLGRFFIRNIAMSFDAYIDQDRQKGPLYSRTV